jgi:hypothetical protein
MTITVEQLLPYASALGTLGTIGGGFLGWAFAQARAMGKWEQRIDDMGKAVAALERMAAELDRSRIDQGGRLGVHDDRIKVLEAVAPRRLQGAQP